MKEINVIGQTRKETGKKASKELRKEGLIPCNLYGELKDENGKPQAVSFTVPMNELRKIVYTPHIYVINLVIDGVNHTSINTKKSGVVSAIKAGLSSCILTLRTGYSPSRLSYFPFQIYFSLSFLSICIGCVSSLYTHQQLYIPNATTNTAIIKSNVTRKITLLRLRFDFCSGVYVFFIFKI